MITAERYERLRRLFEATYELPPAERPAWLDRECRDDPTLRTEIEELLAKHADPSAFMENPALGSSFNWESAIAQRDHDSALVGQRLMILSMTCAAPLPGSTTMPPRSAAMRASFTSSAIPPAAI